MSARMTWPEMQANMARVGKLQAAVKERSMIYDVTQKEYVARCYGLPLDAYYRMSYEEWSVINRAWTARLQLAFAASIVDGWPDNRAVSEWPRFEKFMRDGRKGAVS